MVLVHLDYNLQRVKETLITIFSLKTGLFDVSITFLTCRASGGQASLFQKVRNSQVGFCHQSDKSSQFLSSEQHSKPKGLDVA